jgi:hypothetical protein
MTEKQQELIELLICAFIMLIGLIIFKNAV